MANFRKLLTGLLAFAGILLCVLPAAAQQKPASANVPVTTVVAVLGPSYTAPPAVSKEDIIVHTGSVREDVTGWVAAQGDRAALDLAILIDDATDASIGNQLDDLRKFIQAQSKTTRVGVFYANEGRAQEVSAFSADHNAVSKKLRLTFGDASVSTSLYFSLMDLISKWPASTARREILVIGDGIDRFRGDPFSPDVPATIEKAQKAGIIIHTLYARGAGRAGRNLFRSNYGQFNLAQMTDATGGESFFQGTETPISFAPFLDRLGHGASQPVFSDLHHGAQREAQGRIARLPGYYRAAPRGNRGRPGNLRSRAVGGLFTVPGAGCVRGNHR